MATASKRISRKELRRPDWFQIATDKALEFYRERKAVVFGAVAAVAVAIAVVLGWQAFKDSQNATAGQEFNKAAELYQTEKYREAIAAFEKVQTYRWSRYAGLAHLYQANSHLALGETDKSLSAAQRAVSATKPGTLYRQLALMGLASAQERKGQCKDAISNYSEAQKIAAAYQNVALLGKARCQEQSGDVSGAVASYKEYVKEVPGSPLGLKVEELEARVSAKSGAK